MTKVFNEKFSINLRNCKENLYYKNELFFDIKGEILLNEIVKKNLFIDLEGTFEFVSNLIIGERYNIQLNQFFTLYGDKFINLKGFDTKDRIIIIYENKKYSTFLCKENIEKILNFKFENTLEDKILSGGGNFYVLIKPILSCILCNIKKDMDKNILSFITKF